MLPSKCLPRYFPKVSFVKATRSLVIKFVRVMVATQCTDAQKHRNTHNGESKHSRCDGSFLHLRQTS